MKSSIRLPRMLALILVVGCSAWILGPDGLTASYRTYTADYVPDRLADGFDFPVGANGSASGYYMARKMVPYNHLGDDWNGTGGGNSDYGDPVYSIADGVVVYSQNYGSNWGQVIIVRHKFKDLDGKVKMVDSLYGHVINRRVTMGNFVRRGQQIAQIGNNNGMYLAHLHLEIRSNTAIGIQSWNFSKGSSNYHRPHQFIASRRPGRLPDARFQLASNETKPSVEAPQTPTVQTAAPVPAGASGGMVAVADSASKMPVQSGTGSTAGPVRAALDGVVSLARREPGESPERSGGDRVTLAASRTTAASGTGRIVFAKSEPAKRDASSPLGKRVVDELPRRKDDEESSGDGFFAKLLHSEDDSPHRDRRSRKVPEQKARSDKKGLFGKSKNGSTSQRRKES